MRPDSIAVLDAAYRLDVPDFEWVQGILNAAIPSLDEGLGAIALAYDASDPGASRTLAIAGTGRIGDEIQCVAAIGADAGREVMAEIFAHGGCATASQILGRERFVSNPGFKNHGFTRGFFDFLQVNASDPTGVGCLIGAPRPRTGAVPGRRAAHWSRVAAHLGAALRLRRDLQQRAPTPDGAEVVLDPSGKAQHLAPEAQPAREALRETALAIDRARASQRHEDDGRAALEAWTALVAGRWSLVDCFDRDGRRYFVGVPNAPALHDPRALSERERQVLAFAALGHSNKLIAYELGISPSRVGTTISTIQRKLGVSSRVELVALARSLASAPFAARMSGKSQS
jgi:DNA-binding CsgD family transcriptional regulator